MDMRTTLTVDDEGILTLPPEFLEVTGWKEGDMLEWIDNKDGSFSLIKSDDDEIHKSLVLSFIACLLFGIGIIIAGYIHGNMHLLTTLKNATSS